MINGKIFKDMIISAANNLENCKEEVNNLNVFPVPDGDTGTNMSMTISAARKEVMELDDSSSIASVADAAALAMLKGARGNSGVILSLLFRGFSRQFKGKTTVSAFEFAKGLEAGVKNAYGAVRKPTEGTILTVARVSAEKGMRIARSSKSPVDVIEEIVAAAKATLNDTPKMLPVLKQANVVDAGGDGFVKILEGIYSVIKDKKVVERNAAADEDVSDKADFSSFNTEDIKFAYCTELVISRTNDNDSAALNNFLQRIGDSIVCVEDEGIIKIHVHTNNPGKVLEEGISYGDLVNIKVENMKIQHTEKSTPKAEAPAEPAKESSKYPFAEPVNDYGFVSVCAGEGLSILFKDLAVDTVVEGGQTMNPSTDDLLSAVQATPAKTVFVLPNNKNIIMAAEQVVSIADRRVIVLPTKTVPQGISAMLAFDGANEEDDNISAMNEAASHVKTASVTFAARDSEFDGHSIKEGQYLGLVEGKVSSVTDAVDVCMTEIFGKIIDESVSYVNIFYGEGVAEEDALKLVEGLGLDNVEVNVIPGGQPVYYYIISAE
ncbi:MAG: DAK2 domain-containing protein [Clostridia bacterium]|nr:DAK2 domain-containing protein [Clostridia bacterium]